MRRNHFEIMSDILLLSREKKSKTGILYGANLSYSQLQEYFRLLLDKNLLRLNQVDGKACYKTTEKGHRYLECYQEIQDFLRNKEDANVAIRPRLQLINVSRRC